MRIGIFDSWNGKFAGAIRDHWVSLGHQVAFNPTWEQAQTADLNFFYQADNGLVEATHGKLNTKIVAHCVDIEVWAGQASAVDWTKVSKVMFMAQHIMDKVMRDSVITCPTKLIKPGINLEKFSIRPPNRFTDPIRRIAYVVGDRRIWDVKRLDIALQMTRDLLNSTSLIWQLYIRGTYSSHIQYNAYCDHLIKSLELSDFIVWTDRVEDMNIWLDDKDYFLLPSTKEAFSYATAEAMAKGIKPIINNWEGSKETWGEFACNTYGEMLAEMANGEYTPELYRKYIEDNYDEKRYFRQLDEFLLGGDTNG